MANEQKKFLVLFLIPVAVMDGWGFVSSELGGQLHQWEDVMLLALDAIGTAGFCVNHPDATEEMLKAGGSMAFRSVFRAMVLKGNLAGDEK